jgi:hypothetical protein
MVPVAFPYFAMGVFAVGRADTAPQDEQTNCSRIGIAPNACLGGEAPHIGG